MVDEIESAVGEKAMETPVKKGRGKPKEVTAKAKSPVKNGGVTPKKRGRGRPIKAKKTYPHLVKARAQRAANLAADAGTD